MNITKIREDVEKLIDNLSEDSFIFDLLAAYGKPKSAIKRLREGNYNLSKNKDEINWKKNLLFRKVINSDLRATITDITTNNLASKHDNRFVIVTDFKNLLATDTKTHESLDIPITELPEHIDFFFPWRGIEKYKHPQEIEADIKAANLMAKLYDAIVKDNPSSEPESIKELNIFLSRLLFCYFAEDTEIFEDKQFVTYIATQTNPDGSDLKYHLDQLFKALNTKDKSDLSKHLIPFPYVNGGLFNDKYSAPKFSAGSRKLLIECAEKLDWSTINPDIFGSMIQAVVQPEQRCSMGMHYTSISNIMKVIEPLFLNKLIEEFTLNKDNPKKLNALLNRLYNLKIFDPACGSGNFLIVIYKELCKLEIKIFQQLHSLSRQKSLRLSKISLSQFYGIEIDSFAREVAALSLWIAEHQMNMEFKKIFNKVNPLLPLKEAGRIICGNAARLPWEEVCPKNDGDEIYIVGNPPYLGSKMQNNEQKKDLTLVIQESKEAKNLDYVACWFAKGASYIQSANAKLAFVSTNSICQGEQVALLWPHIFAKALEIGFAHRSFKWTNNAKKNAGVTCIIIGLRNKSNEAKYVMDNGIQYQVNNINAYLQDAGDLIIGKRMMPISKLPKMLIGNKAVDGGNLILTESEKDDILIAHPEASKFIKKFIGAQEFIQGKQRWCLWVKDNDIKEVYQVAAIKKRIDAARLFRLKSLRSNTLSFAEKPYRFAEITYKESNFIIIPKVFSEHREYITAGFLDKTYVISDSAQAIYDAETYIFGIISSKMHIAWVKAVGGRLKTDLRYSSSLCYNNFPVPDLTDKQKEIIAHNALNVISEREKHPEKTIAQLYDTKKMPQGLREAHRNLDLAVEACYRAKPFASDEERLAHLFKLYEQMTEVENA